MLVIWIAFFRGKLLPNNTLRNKPIFHAFRAARPWHYFAFFLLRSPALLAAVAVYTAALNLFGVEASMLNLLPLLPVIFFAAAVPTPMRAAALFGLCCFQIMKARWQRLDSFSTISLFCLTRLLACYFGGVRNEISLGLNFQST